MIEKTLIDICQLITFVVGPNLREHTCWPVLVGSLQVVFDGVGDLRSSTLAVFGHLVESKPIIVVLQLSEMLHAAIKIVVDDGEAVSVIVESFPSRHFQVLGIVG